MKSNRIAALVASLFAFACSGALAHDDPAGAKAAKLGKVTFKTSCNAQAQKEFEVALARLHSFHFPETLKSFGARRRETKGERRCCKNDEDDNASHASVLLQGICQLARENYFSPDLLVKT